jgi:hypothetical protein
MRYLATVTLIASGCWLSTPLDDCPEVVAWVSFQGSDCPDAVRRRVPVEVMSNMRAHFEAPFPACELAYEERRAVDGLELAFSEGVASPGDEAAFDRIVELVVSDGDEVCSERWGLLLFAPPCDTTVPDEPQCSRGEL